MVRESWGWTGLDPAEIVGQNDFGNLMVKDFAGRYWRLCPEELTCRRVARNRQELDALSRDQEFLHDWNMKELVAQAQRLLGPLKKDTKFCLKIPAVLGGEYSGSNLATLSLPGLIRSSGDVARQIKDLPDGARVQLDVKD